MNMTEDKWLDSTDPFFLMACIYKKSTGWLQRLRDASIGPRRTRKRKDLLVNCSFSRRYWESLRPDEQEAIETVERMIDVRQVCEFREAADRSTVAAWTVLRQFDREFAHRYASGLTEEMAIALDRLEQVSKELSRLIREVYGNPFRSVTLDSRWLTSTVIDLASTIYDDRAYHRMPILADALMDAGCDSEEIISHCRSEGPHVRGCWVVDLLSGRK